MKKTKLLLLIPLMLLAPIFGVASVRGTVQGTTEVCVTAVGAADCSTPTTFDSASFTPGSTISVAVNIQNAPTINAFSISIQTDGSVLQGSNVAPQSVISGTPGGVCIDGFPQDPNNNKCTVNDGLGIISVTATAPAGSSFSGSGTLFTITYNVVSTGFRVPIGFGQFCPGSSDSPNCVTLANAGSEISAGSPFPNNFAVTEMASEFSNLFDYTFSATPAFQSFQSSGSGSIMVSMSPSGLFTGMVTVSNSVSPAGLSCAPASTSVGLPATVTLSCSGSNGDYMVTVSGSAAGVSPDKSATVEVVVSAPDFQFKASTNTLSVDQASSQSATYTAVPLSGFSSDVSVAVSGPTVSGLTLSLSSNTIPGASGSVTLTATNIHATPGTYSYTVTGTSGSIQHSQPLAVTVPAPDFRVLAVPGVVSELYNGLTGSTALEVRSLHGFSGTVTLTSQVLTNGIVGTFVGPFTVLMSSSVTVTPTTPGTASVSVVYPKNVALGNYTVVLTGTSGTLQHSAPFNFTITDFSTSISKTSFNPTPCAPVPGHTYPSACRDSGLLFSTSLGGLTGFNTSTLGQQFIGYNCVNTPIAAINPANVACVDYQEYFPNGTLVPKATIKAGLAPILVFSPRFGFPFPSNSLMCLLFSAGNFGLPIPPELAAVYNTLPGSFAAGTVDNNAGNETDLPQFLDPSAPAGSTGLPCSGDDFASIRTFAFPQTVPGAYKVFIDVSLSVLDHPIGNVTIIVAQPPAFNQVHYKHHLSFAASGGALAITVGITNPDPNIGETAFVRATVTGNGFSLTGVTATVSLAPGQTINNLAITIPLDPAMIGQTFTVKLVIVWGSGAKAPKALSTASIGGVPTTGTVTITA